MKDMHLDMFPLQAYIMQTLYMSRTLINLFKISTHNVIAFAHHINKRLMQFPSRDDGTPQEKLVDDEIMDILENTLPRSWQEEMQRE
eukprot:12069303-Ditylum_brightwellii.AAC.1